MPLSVFLNINWREILLGKEDWVFLWEVGLRTGLMFLIIIIGLRILGKRSIKQLSIFELVVIIGLGSAAGDPMFYKEVGIITCATVFVVIIILYSIITFFIGKTENFEKVMEGSPSYLIRNGKFAIKNFKKEKMGNQELMSELRVHGISQLGQVETVIEEMSGELSVFFYEDKDVKYGLPIMPHLVKNSLTEIKEIGYYSCEYCGHTEYKSIGSAGMCKICEKDKWVFSSNKRRVT